MQNQCVYFPAIGMTAENREQYLKSLAYLLGMYVNGEYRTTDLKNAGVNLFKGVEFDLQWVIDDLAKREEAGEINSMQAAMQLEELRAMEDSLGLNETFMMRHIALNLDRIPAPEVAGVQLQHFPKALYIRRMKETIIALREGLGLTFVDNAYDINLMESASVESEDLLKASLNPEEKNPSVQDALKSIRNIEEFRREIKAATEENRGWSAGSLNDEAEEELRIYCCSFFDQLVNAYLALKQDKSSTTAISLVDHTKRPLAGVEKNLQVIYGRTAEPTLLHSIALDYWAGQDGAPGHVAFGYCMNEFHDSTGSEISRADLIPDVVALLVQMLCKEAGTNYTDEFVSEQLQVIPADLLPDLFDYDPAKFADILIKHAVVVEDNGQRNDGGHEPVSSSFTVDNPDIINATATEGA